MPEIRKPNYPGLTRMERSPKRKCSVFKPVKSQVNKSITLPTVMKQTKTS